MADKFPKQYGILLQKAKADIAIAFRALDAGDNDIDNATILFHFQQAVEKLLKALLSINQIHFEKIHDIALLIDLCKTNKIQLPDYLGDFSELNVYAVIGRYDIMDDAENDPRKYREKLIEFKKFVENTIQGFSG
jgi:HEPN domain-containing protein